MDDPVRLCGMLRNEPVASRLPIGLRLLFVASMLVLAGGLVGDLYGFFVGIPVSDLNSFFLPILLTGLAMLVVANAWKWRLEA